MSSIHDRVAFTGSQQGMTEQQMIVMRSLVREIEAEKVGHGCCIGADVEFHLMAQTFRPDLKIVLFPSTLRGKQALIWTSREVTTHVPELPLKRNRKLVAWCDRLIATPDTAREILRSGTWATVRYAREAEKRITIVYPDGRIEWEGW